MSDKNFDPAIVRMLVVVARAAHRAMDDGGDNGKWVRIERQHAQVLSDALDALDELPDPPGMTVGPGWWTAAHILGFLDDKGDLIEDEEVDMTDCPLCGLKHDMQGAICTDSGWVCADCLEHR